MVNNIAEFNHLFSAFQQVKENKGCAGVDGVTIEEFETELPKNLSMLSHDLKLDESAIVSFDQGFKYLGVTFVRSLIMVPFDKPKKERKVLFYPPPLNMAAYYLKKKRGW